MKLDLLHNSDLQYPTNLLNNSYLRYRKKKRKKPKNRSPTSQWLAKPTQLMPGMHEIPHMDGTHGNVPRPGKPVWAQR